MKNLIPLLALAACDDAALDDPAESDLERKDVVVEPLTGETVIDLACADEPCKLLRATVIPEADVQWLLDDRPLGDGPSVELTAESAWNHELVAVLGKHDFAGAWLAAGPLGGDGSTATVALGVASSRSCNHFWIQTVGGCIVTPLAVDITADALPLAQFRRTTTTSPWGAPQLGGGGWASWWPGGYTPSQETLLGTLGGLGVVFTVGSAPQRLTLSHGGAQHLIGYGVCDNGVANVWGPDAI